MAPGDSGAEQTRAAAARLDPESAEWRRILGDTGPRREEALARLHQMLVRIARGEVRRRAPRLNITGPELDDLAHQAAGDALVAITGKLGRFRGESRFTTWAYKFLIFEVSAKIGRHFWRHPAVPFDAGLNVKRSGHVWILASITVESLTAGSAVTSRSPLNGSVVSRVVFRVQVFEAKRPDRRDLGDVLTGFGPVEMRGAGGQDEDGTGRVCLQLSAVELFAQADVETPEMTV